MHQIIIIQIHAIWSSHGIQFIKEWTMENPQAWMFGMRLFSWPLIAQVILCCVRVIGFYVGIANSKQEPEWKQWFPSKNYGKMISIIDLRTSTKMGLGFTRPALTLKPLDVLDFVVPSKKLREEYQWGEGVLSGRAVLWHRGVPEVAASIISGFHIPIFPWVWFLSNDDIQVFLPSFRHKRPCNRARVEKPMGDRPFG